MPFDGSAAPGGGGGATTWNPSDKNADLGLTGSNLIVTNNVGGNYAQVRGTTSIASGKKYFEITVNTINTPGQSAVGIGNASGSLSVFNDGNEIGWFGDGTVYQNGSSVGIIANWIASNVLCVATDKDNNKIWFRVGAGTWNGGSSGDPDTNLNGINISAITGAIFPMAQLKFLNDQFTVNFGATSYAQTPPSLFGNW